VQRRNNLIDFRKVAEARTGQPLLVPPRPANDSFEPLADYNEAVKARFNEVRPSISDRKVSTLVAVLDFSVVLGFGLLAGFAYHMSLLGDAGPMRFYGSYAIAFAMVFSLMMLATDRYHIVNLYDQQRMTRDLALRYVASFSIVVTGVFLTKLADDLSRVTLVLQFFVMLAALMVARSVAHRAIVWGTKFGVVRARRVVLVGSDQAISSFARQFQPWNDGIWIVGTSVIPAKLIADSRIEQARFSDADRERLERDCRQALPDDIILVLPWDAEELIRDIALTVSSVPAAIHIAPERAISWLQAPNYTSVGNTTTLSIIREPLTTSEQMVKRLFDIAFSASALLVASPILIAVAIGIKLQDGGAVFYRQKRHGFNQDPFDILKFRTMTKTASESAFVQAQKNDVRITLIGRFLRRTNIDELPQLINVLKGDMSLVGPRPHALAHNEEFEDRIVLYARRHNVRPGITGWAQVNGFRGPTDTLEKMDHRVDHDLFYIDNWSLLLDLRIVLMTLFGRRAYRNAH
jgi:Undecaprenyl-phosphate glucose phosphotransferase